MDGGRSVRAINGHEVGVPAHFESSEPSVDSGSVIATAAVPLDASVSDGVNAIDEVRSGHEAIAKGR
jgi:hypothetical protein